MSNTGEEMSPGGSGMLRHGPWTASMRSVYRQALLLKPGKGSAALPDVCADNNDICMSGRGNAARQSLGLF